MPITYKNTDVVARRENGEVTFALDDEGLTIDATGVDGAQQVHKLDGLQARHLYWAMAEFYGPTPEIEGESLR